MNDIQFFCVFFMAPSAGIWDFPDSITESRSHTHINFLCVHKSECQQLLLYSGIFAEVCVLNLSFMGYKQIVLTGL